MTVSAAPATQMARRCNGVRSDHFFFATTPDYGDVPALRVPLR